MNLQTRREVRFRLIALVLSGLLFTVSVILRGPIDSALSSLMRAALCSAFVSGVAVGLIGGVIQIYRFFGLYPYITYQREDLTALPAIVLNPLGIVLVLPLVSFLAVHVPVIAELYQQGNHAVYAVVEANFTSPLGLTMLGTSSMAGNIIGGILFAIAIWRDGRLSK